MRRNLIPFSQRSSDPERERLAILNAPPAPTPPELLKPTKCRVLKTFFVAGQRVEIGETITLPAHDAKSMQVLGRVELL